MRRLIPFLLLIISTVSSAESGAYRVEVIVFHNLEAVAEPINVEEFRSFSNFPDLEQIFRDDLPDDLTVITSKGAYMDDVWQHLRNSSGYRPLLYSAWQQNQVDYYPPMRIHDQNELDSQLRPPTKIIVADLTASDPLAEYRSDFYQLDGSVQLRRSRFLHLYLDLEYRERPAPAHSESGLLTADDRLTDFYNGITQQTGYEIHTLKQNRPVRTGQLQYFDTPYFGVLVFVSDINGE